MIALYIILAVIACLIIVILARTAAFKPKPQKARSFEAVEFDRKAAVDALGALVRCRTVSNADPALEDDAEFEKLVGLLPQLYPNVYRVCGEPKRFEGRGLLFCWKGRETGKPSVLMAHYDVVPVDEENWKRDPFGAEIADGVMWGRGTIDTKVTFNGILSAANNLIAQGFTPKNDLYFAFSGGEEVNGPGASNIVDWFAEQGIELEMVVDEGGAVVQGVFPGVSTPCALVGIAEKGQLNLEFAIDSDGGHASAPAPHTPIGELSAACVALENHPFKAHYTKPVLEMFDTLGRHSNFAYRMIFANLWCFGPVLDMVCKKSGGELNALVRTTVAFTMMSGSKAPNVIPPVSSMTANLRLNPEDSIASAYAYVKQTIANEKIVLKQGNSMEPSRISRTDCEGWERVSNAILGTWKGCLVSPYLMVQCSDCRHYGRISDRVYRFSAADMTTEERHSIHGNNERIRLEVIERATEFFIRVIKQC